MKHVGAAITVTFLIILRSGLSMAQSSSLQKIRQTDDQSLAVEIGLTNSLCGTHITARLVWDGFSGEDVQKYSAAGYCDDALTAIEQLCADEDGKKYVAKMIKEVVCTKGVQQGLSLKDGVLTYAIDWNAKDRVDFVKEYLEDASP